MNPHWSYMKVDSPCWIRLKTRKGLLNSKLKSALMMIVNMAPPIIQITKMTFKEKMMIAWIMGLETQFKRMPLILLPLKLSPVTQVCPLIPLKLSFVEIKGFLMKPVRKWLIAQNKSNIINRVDQSKNHTKLKFLLEDQADLSISLSFTKSTSFLF